MSSSTSTTTVQRKKVVIVGGGYGGVTLAAELDSKYDVVLVEKKQVFFHNVAALRLTVEPSLATKTFMPYDKLLKKGRVVHQLATEISATKVVLDNGEELTFDYLVIATGTNNMTPFKSPVDTSSAYPYYKDINAKIGQATKILIVGGGAVGVELAGEIATDFKGKNITIVNNVERLVSPLMNDKFNKQLLSKLDGLGVKVMSSTSVNIPEDIVAARDQQVTLQYNVEMKTYETSNGPVEADLVFWSIGNKNNSDTLQAHFAANLDQNSRLKVNPSLQVEGHQNIFAIGDITNVVELKTSYNAAYHAAVVAKNINAIEKSKPGKEPKLATHTPTGAMLSVSLGRKDGISQLPNGMILGGFLTSSIKSKGLFISRFAKALGNPKSAEIGYQK